MDRIVMLWFWQSTEQLGETHCAICEWPQCSSVMVALNYITVGRPRCSHHIRKGNVIFCGLPASVTHSNIVMSCLWQPPPPPLLITGRTWPGCELLSVMYIPWVMLEHKTCIPLFMGLKKWEGNTPSQGTWWLSYLDNYSLLSTNIHKDIRRVQGKTAYTWSSLNTIHTTSPLHLYWILKICFY